MNIIRDTSSKTTPLHGFIIYIDFSAMLVVSIKTLEYSANATFESVIYSFIPLLANVNENGGY